jgi:hypothetical protein
VTPVVNLCCELSCASVRRGRDKYTVCSSFHDQRWSKVIISQIFVCYIYQSSAGVYLHACYYSCCFVGKLARFARYLYMYSALFLFCFVAVVFVCACVLFFFLIQISNNS